jgi:hypothetical protein
MVSWREIGIGVYSREWKRVVLLAEHVSDEIHLLLCSGNLLRRRGLRATESEHRHDGGLYVGLGDNEAVDLRCALRRCVLCSGLGFRRCLVLEPKFLEALSAPQLYRR